MAGIKRRYEELEKVARNRKATVHLSKSGPTAVELKEQQKQREIKMLWQRRKAARRITALKNLTYQIFKKHGILNVYFEEKDALRELAAEGGDRLEKFQMYLKYGEGNPVDFDKAMDILEE